MTLREFLKNIYTLGVTDDTEIGLIEWNGNCFPALISREDLLPGYAIIMDGGRIDGLDDEEEDDDD